MTKHELVSSVAQGLAVTQQEAERVVDMVLDQIGEGLRSEGTTLMGDFGTFRKVGISAVLFSSGSSLRRKLEGLRG